MSTDPLLAIEDLSIAFDTDAGPQEVVHQVGFSVHRGEWMALVGESGSGKTVTALSITRLLPEPSIAYIRGKILFDGQNLNVLSEARVRPWRGGRIAYVFQEPATALNPVFTVSEQIAECFRLHGESAHWQKRIEVLLDSVGLRDPKRVARAYPHQLSGGQQQRVMVAMALAGQPELLVADEPTTALDVTVQAQILDLLKELQRKHGMAVLFITHNLAIAAQLADRITVMYAGQVVESGKTPDVIAAPRHPYTAALLKAVPRLRNPAGELQGIPGSIPTAADWPSGCRFHPRCPNAQEQCRHQSPPLIRTGEDRVSRCFFWEEVGRS